MPRPAAALALALALAAGGCTRAMLPAHVILLVPKCPDGLPPRLEVDVACPPNGICGFSCHPARWEPAPLLVKG